MSPYFIDTSNRFDLLTDPTGSHRFLCVEVERMLQVQNAVFYRVCHAEDVFHSYFRVANPGEKSLGLTAARIFRELQQKNSAAMRSVNPMRFGQVLLKAGGGVVTRSMEMCIKW